MRVSAQEFNPLAKHLVATEAGEGWEVKTIVAHRLGTIPPHAAKAPAKPESTENSEWQGIPWARKP